MLDNSKKNASMSFLNDSSTHVTPLENKSNIFESISVKSIIFNSFLTQSNFQIDSSQFLFWFIQNKLPVKKNLNIE